jgi:hypothetical protein
MASELGTGPWTVDYAEMLTGTQGIAGMPGLSTSFNRSTKVQLQRLNVSSTSNEIVPDVVEKLQNLCRRYGFHPTLVVKYPLDLIRAHIADLRKSADELIEVAGKKKQQADNIEEFLEEHENGLAQEHGSRDDIDDPVCGVDPYFRRAHEGLAGQHGTGE